MPDLCVFCGGDVEQRVTRVIEEVGDDIIVIAGVPAGVCAHCGEKEFAPDTVRCLEEIRRERRSIRQHRSVPVVEYGKLAA